MVILMISARRTLERLNNYARSSEARHAKFATRILTQMKEKETLCADLVEVCHPFNISLAS